MADLVRRILVVHNHYQHVGGEDITVASETSLLRHNGLEVIEYVDSNKRIDDMSPVSAAAQTIWSQDSYDALLALIREKKPDVAHFHNTFLLISPSAYYACQEMNLPVVQTIHNYRLSCPAGTFYRDGKVCEDCLGRKLAWPGVLHRCYRNSHLQSFVVASMLAYHWSSRTWQEQVDAYIALTDFSREKLIQFGVPAEKIFLKPVFVEDILDSARHAGDFALFLGRLSPDKGLITLLTAFSQLDFVPLKIAGDGPLRNHVEEFSRSNPHIHYLGFQDRNDINSLLCNARFMVLPSEWYEVSPRIIMEAYSCRLPIIASRLGAMAELVRDGETGLLFEPGDADDLASKVKWLWGNPQEIIRLGNNARKEYEEKYTPDRNYQMLMNIYSKAIEGQKRQNS